MDKLLYSPTARYSIETKIKKSRFIGTGFPIHSPAEVKTLIEKQREHYSGCSHVVHAYLIGDRKSESCGMSDDGEPKGTAGRPVLDRLRHSGLTDILITVVRYFGGTKLGTGGLVRAYSDSARRVVEGIPKRPKRKLVDFTLDLSYELFEGTKKILAGHEAQIKKENFTSKVSITGSIPEAEVPSAEEELRNLSNGSISSLVDSD